MTDKFHHKIEDKPSKQETEVVRSLVRELDASDGTKESIEKFYSEMAELRSKVSPSSYKSIIEKTAHGEDKNQGLNIAPTKYDQKFLFVPSAKECEQANEEMRRTGQRPY